MVYIWYNLRNIAHVPLMSIRTWLGKALCLDTLMTRIRDPHHRWYIQIYSAPTNAEQDVKEHHFLKNPIPTKGDLKKLFYVDVVYTNIFYIFQVFFNIFQYL